TLGACYKVQDLRGIGERDDLQILGSRKQSAQRRADDLDEIAGSRGVELCDLAKGRCGAGSIEVPAEDAHKPVGMLANLLGRVGTDNQTVILHEDCPGTIAARRLLVILQRLPEGDGEDKARIHFGYPNDIGWQLSGPFRPFDG